MKQFGYFILLFAQSLSLLASEFELVTGNDYPPLSDNNLLNGGIATEIVSEAMTKLYGPESYTISFVPWSRGYQEAKEGKYVGTFPYAKNDEREVDFLYSDPLMVVEQKFFVKKGASTTFEVDTDLKGHIVCKPIGYNLDDIQRFIDADLITVQRPQTMENCFKMLKLNRVSLVVAGELLSEYLLANTQGMSMEDFDTLEQSLGERSLHLIVSKTYPNGREFIERFNKVLTEMKGSGQISDIIDKHLKRKPFN